jgi:hypothetical protein
MTTPSEEETVIQKHRLEMLGYTVADVLAQPATTVLK